jgi:hypothetical protein
MTDPDRVIEEFLEGRPRAETWGELRDTLAARLRDAVAERDALPADDPARAALEKRVRALREQVAALAQEAAVTQFVEDSVRAALSRPRPDSDWGDDEDGGG